MTAIINELRNSLINKELNFAEIENMVESLFTISKSDTFLYEDNRYYAFENMCHSYEIDNDKWINIKFEANTAEDFDIYEDKLKVIEVDIE